MQITQKPSFEPITIVLETAAEAKALCFIVDNFSSSDAWPAGGDVAHVLNVISNEFTNHLKV